MRATTAPRPTGPSSARPQPTPISAKGGAALSGPSNLPDPEYHAFRKDLADVGLAGRVIASHYAEPVERRIAAAAPLRDGPGDGAEVRQLHPGERFALLDDSLGWAWGYAGEDRRVGYVPSAILDQ